MDDIIRKSYIESSQMHKTRLTKNDNKLIEYFNEIIEICDKINEEFNYLENERIKSNN